MKHGLYSRRFDPEEVEALSGMQDGVKDEIELTRVNLSRIAEYINSVDMSKMTVEDYVALQNLIAKYTATVGRLKQIDKALSDSANVGIHAQLLAALEEVNASLELRD